MAKNDHENLSVQQEQAATLVAAGELTHEQIAQQVGVGARTLTRWKQLTAFQARVILLRKKATWQLQEETIASVQERIRRRDRRWKRLDRLVETRAQRAEQESDASEEAKTGLYVPVHTRYRDGREERTHQFDRDLVRAMGSMEELTGRELGQHVHKTEVSGPGGGPVQIDPRATAGYVLGTVADAAMYFTALIRAGRVKTGREDMAVLAREINDRIEARRLGLEVPPLSEPYALPELPDDLL